MIEVLQQAIQALEPYGKSRDVVLYELPRELGLEGYLLRGRASSLSGQFAVDLQSTTSLNPVSMIPTLPAPNQRLQVGQPLLYGYDENGFTLQIMEKIPGKTLKASYDTFLAQHPDTPDHQKAIENAFTYVVNKIPKEGLDEFLATIDVLTALGVAVDMHWDNLIPDKEKGTLRLFDCHYGSEADTVAERNNLEDIMRGIIKFKGTLTDLSQVEQLPEVSILREQLEAAAERTGFSKTPAEARQKIEFISGLYPVSISMGSTLLLDAAPEDLRSMLTEMSSYTVPSKPRTIPGKSISRG